MIETTPVHVISVSLEPTTEADAERLTAGLQVLTSEDPTMTVRPEAEGAVTIFGIGERHLEIVVDRLHGEFQVAARLGRPQVTYKEAFSIAADGEATYRKEAGGSGQFAHVELRLLPGERGAGYVFRNEIAGGAIPEMYVASIDAGIRDALLRGVVAGYPIDDVRIEVCGGSHDEGQSSPAAFRIAGAMAFRDAAAKAGALVLEPVMRVEVVTPADFASDLLADLVSRRGDVLSERAAFMTVTIQARVPMARMLGYAPAIRDLSRGRATYSIQFDRYQAR